MYFIEQWMPLLLQLYILLFNHKHTNTKCITKYRQVTDNREIFSFKMFTFFPSPLFPSLSLLVIMPACLYRNACWCGHFKLISLYFFCYCCRYPNSIFCCMDVRFGYFCVVKPRYMYVRVRVFTNRRNIYIFLFYFQGWCVRLFSLFFFRLKIC